MTGAPPSAAVVSSSEAGNVAETLSAHVETAHITLAPLMARPHAVHAYALPAAVAVAALLAVLLFCFLRPRKMKRVLLNYDVEGGSNAQGHVLPAAVLQAATDADVATLRQWLADERCVIDASAADGSTALHIAAKQGHANVIRLLIEAGADALCVDSEQRSALHHVAKAGHGLCVKALLDAGADVEGRDGEGKTPLQLAEANRHMGCLRMMRLGLERRSQSSDKAFRRAK
ncbi:hypothetical protein AB1Y20_005527 [Prymnesium parvum]|uniref:Uncharacterized protein n=1 Tax=Prymnesium parvum TaxID=97485 RepID=A0AB34J617_PRYPA